MYSAGVDRMHNCEFKHIAAEKVNHTARKGAGSRPLPVKSVCGEGQAGQPEPEENQENIQCFRMGRRNKNSKEIKRMKADDGVDVIPGTDRKVIASQIQMSVQEIRRRLSQPLPRIAQLKDVLGYAVPVSHQAFSGREKRQKDQKAQRQKRQGIDHQIFLCYPGLTHR